MSKMRKGEPGLKKRKFSNEIWSQSSNKSGNLKSWSFEGGQRMVDPHNKASIIDEKTTNMSQDAQDQHNN